MTELLHAELEHVTGTTRRLAHEVVLTYVDPAYVDVVSEAGNETTRPIGWAGNVCRPTRRCRKAAS